MSWLRPAALLALLWLGCGSAAQAAREVVEIYFLPLQEAADAARSQLSGDGKVAALPSRHMLILDDDKAHIARAIALLKRLDRQPGQYTAYLNIEESSDDAGRNMQAAAQLPGGWVRLRLGGRNSHAANRQAFQLRISGSRPGRIETSVIRPLPRTHRWLASYGVTEINSVAMTPITSGFNIVVRPAGSDKVRVRITPWMQRADARVRGNQEMLIDLGSAAKPATPPSNSAALRLNARPQLQQQPQIEISGAATELVIPLDQSVTIAAQSQEAEQLAAALLSRHSAVGRRMLVMHLRISKQ